ncbi:MAG: hypothetical protein Q8Q31_01810 [Nanoarchaeota archaeon]|nr:hypothetical protein [Nanoarchaeota archaeon]
MVKKEERNRNNSIDNSSGITALNFGVMGVLLSLLIPLFGIILGVLGVIFGYRQKDTNNNSWAKWGIGLSLLSLALGIFLFVWVKLNPVPLV